MIKDRHNPALINKYSAYCPEGTTIIPGMITLRNGVSLLWIRFMPSGAEGLPEILFLPGLASIIENFKEILKVLTRRFTVHYVETREKKSSVVPRGAGFGVGEIASDLSLVIKNIFPCDKRYMILGYSLGATSSAEAIPLLNNKPLKLILIEPNSRFNFPPVILFLARYFVFMYHPLRPFIKWYMKKYHINIEEDYEMYLINSRAIDAASPRKVAAAVRAISEYDISSVLPKIDVPVVIIGASKDIFHSHDQAKQIFSAIRDCTFVEMENNKRTHSQEVADWIMSNLE